MAKRERFQAQKLNSHDYERIESGAEAVKEGGFILSTCVALFYVTKKYGPSLIKNISKIIKV